MRSVVVDAQIVVVGALVLALFVSLPLEEGLRVFLLETPAKLERNAVELAGVANRLLVPVECVFGEQVRCHEVPPVELLVHPHYLVQSSVQVVGADQGLLVLP